MTRAASHHQGGRSVEHDHVPAGALLPFQHATRYLRALLGTASVERFERGRREPGHLGRDAEALDPAALEAGHVRWQNPVILEVNAKGARDAGVVIHKAGKTVYTTKEVPGEFLSRSQRVEEELPTSEKAPDSPA